MGFGRVAGALEQLGVDIRLLVDGGLGGTQDGFQKFIAFFLDGMRGMTPRGQTAYPRVRGRVGSRPISLGHLHRGCGTSLGENGRGNCIGLLPEEAILISAFIGRLALLTATAYGILTIAAEFSAATLHTCHGAPATFPHPLLLGRGFMLGRSSNSGPQRLLLVKVGHTERKRYFFFFSSEKTAGEGSDLRRKS